MEQAFVLILLSTYLFIFIQAGSAEKKDCGAILEPENTMNLTISVLRNSTGDWITLFSAEKAVGYSKNATSLQIKQTVVKSGQANIVRISGVIRDGVSNNFVGLELPGRSEDTENASLSNETAPSDMKEEHSDVLRFHENTGRNIVLINYRQTAYRKDPYDHDTYAGLFTSRPLMYDEMFQVKLDKIINKWSTYALYIGVTLQKPYDIGNTSLVSHDGNGTWSLRYSNVVLDEKTINGSYPIHLKNLSLGTRIGVMRKKNRDLHFFLNGVDKGVAAKYVPGPVYGIFDLANYGAQISIVD